VHSPCARAIIANMVGAYLSGGPAMSTYVVTADVRFQVRMGDENGQVVATFSNRMAAEKYAEVLRRIKDKSIANSPPDDKPS
jgi:hypothetical protein